ncbi:uncharacterized protein LOC129919027 [Episyrphus balteatus]|uniref:uncharacterized protein LOC129919027 n=1 Tax=Episyrphus balteatus TaxID=286459 RepID=UPI0024851E28|nr:uncharacterized protein LOC129919027 [Episyrphus balteatus]
MKSKPKKLSSSSGFGSNKSSLNAPNHKSFSKSFSSTKNTNRKEPTIKEKDKTKPIVEDDDKDLNSGFGDYIRSPEAAEMMKLFVVANSVVIILTMAWPGIKEIYKTFEEWWFYKNLNI